MIAFALCSRTDRDVIATACFSPLFFQMLTYNQDVNLHLFNYLPFLTSSRDLNDHLLTSSLPSGLQSLITISHFHYFLYFNVIISCHNYPSVHPTSVLPLALSLLIHLSPSFSSNEQNVHSLCSRYVRTLP